MIRIIVLLSILVSGCSSRSLTRNDLIKLSVFHQDIPATDKTSAKEFMEDQKKYIVFLKESFKGSTMSEACRSEKIVGEIKETKTQLSYSSLVRIDRHGKPTACTGMSFNVLVWDMYVYCNGDSKILNIKVSKEHMPELKDISICE